MTGGFMVNMTCVDFTNNLWDEQQGTVQNKNLKTDIEADSFMDIAIDCGWAYGYHGAEQGCL